MKELIDKWKLLERLKYLNSYNEPCPEWVFKAITASEADYIFDEKAFGYELDSKD